MNWFESWQEWAAGHPWTLLYLMAVATANFVLEIVEAVTR